MDSLTLSKVVVALVIALDLVVLLGWLYQKKDIQNKEMDDTDHIMSAAEEIVSLRQKVRSLERYIVQLEAENAELKAKILQNESDKMSGERSIDASRDHSVTEEIEYLRSRGKSTKAIAQAVGKGIDEIQLIQFVQGRKG